jgi:hypothetical protein
MLMGTLCMVTTSPQAQYLGLYTSSAAGTSTQHACIDEWHAQDQIIVVAVAGHDVQLQLDAELVCRVALAEGEVQRRAHSAQGGDPVPITGVQGASTGVVHHQVVPLNPFTAGHVDRGSSHRRWHPHMAGHRVCCHLSLSATRSGGPGAECGSRAGSLMTRQLQTPLRSWRLTG